MRATEDCLSVDVDVALPEVSPAVFAREAAVPVSKVAMSPSVVPYMTRLRNFLNAADAACLIGHFCYGGQGMALRTLYYVFQSRNRRHARSLASQILLRFRWGGGGEAQSVSLSRPIYLTPVRSRHLRRLLPLLRSLRHLPRFVHAGLAAGPSLFR